MNEVVTIVDLIDDSPDDVVLVDVQNTMVAELILSEIEKNVTELRAECKVENKSKSMKKVFNTLIMPAYNALDKHYKSSKHFQKVLTNTLQSLKKDPSHKFLHMKHLYETMKLYKVKKKASFVTLAVNLSDEKSNNNNKRKIDSNGYIVKKNQVDIIDLDKDPTCKEHDDDEVILLDDPTDLNGEKENVSEISVASEKITKLPTTDGVINKNINSHAHDPLVNENSLLVPINAVTLIKGIENIDEEKKSKIDMIERKIAHYKEAITILEKQEVDADTLTSPYIKCDKYKAQIVDLYKELCKLTGTDSVKRREIRLTVNQGHPPGPVRRLEMFLNNRIEGNGLPPFPDFNDVVNCVIISNQIDNLGWNQLQIMREATSLFTQCGRALQRRRQNREWRYLMDTVKEEQFEVNDPAENDPELEARLQQNRRIAIRKENDILNRFTMMQEQPRFRQLNRKLNEALQTVCVNSASSSKASSESFNENNKDITETSVNEVSDKSVSDGNVIVKSEKVEEEMEVLKDSVDNFTTPVRDIEDPSLVIEISSDSSSEED